jgi:DDE superfamily endonuclease
MSTGKSRKYNSNSSHAGANNRSHSKTFRHEILEKFDKWKASRNESALNKTFYEESLTPDERKALPYGTFKSWITAHKKEPFTDKFDKLTEYEKKLKRKRNNEYNEAEEFVVKYLEHRRVRMKDDNCGVNYDVLRMKVREFISQLLIKEKGNQGIQEQYTGWTPSNGWFEKVMKRNDLTSIKLHGEAGEIDVTEAEKKMDEFRNKLETLMDENKVPLERVYNADQWAWYYQKLPDRAIVKNSQKKDVRGTKGMKAKERMTGMVAVSAIGHKIDLAIIGKPKHPHCFDHLPRCSETKRAKTPLPYNNNKTAWFNQSILIWWLTKVFQPNYIAKHGQCTCILILDNFNKIGEENKVSVRFRV